MRFWGKVRALLVGVEMAVTEVPSGLLVTMVCYKHSVLEPKKVYLLAYMWRA